MPFQCPWDVGSMGRLYVDLHFCWLIHMVILYTSIYLLNATCMRLMDLSWGFGIENLNFDMHSGERVFSVDIPIHVWYIYQHLPYLAIKNNQMSVNVSYMDGMGLHLSLYISRSHFLPSALQMHQLHPITKRESRGCFFVVAQVMLEENFYFHKFPFQYPCSLTMGIGCATKTFDMFSNSQTLA